MDHFVERVIGNIPKLRGRVTLLEKLHSQEHVEHSRSNMQSSTQGCRQINLASPKQADDHASRLAHFE